MASLNLLWVLLILTPTYAFFIFTPEQEVTNKTLHLNKYYYKTGDANKDEGRKQDWNKYYYETIDDKKENKVNDASNVSEGAVLTDNNKSSNNDDIREIIYTDLAIDKESLSGITDERQPSDESNKKTVIDPQYLEEVIGNFSDSKGEKETTEMPSDDNENDKDDPSMYMDAFGCLMNSATDNSKTSSSDEEDTSYDDEIEKDDSTKYLDAFGDLMTSTTPSSDYEATSDDDEIEKDDSTKYLDAFGDLMNGMNSSTPSSDIKAPSDDNDIDENDSTKYWDAFGDLMTRTDNDKLNTPYSGKTEATCTIENGMDDSKPPSSGTEESSGISENGKDDYENVFGPPPVNDVDIENQKTPSSEKVDPYWNAFRDILNNNTNSTAAPSIGEDEPTDKYLGKRFLEYGKCLLNDGSQGVCVDTVQCDEKGFVKIIDTRSSQCSDHETCCRVPEDRPTTEISPSPTIPRGCGYSFPERNNKNYASRGEFPWIVAIFRGPFQKFQGGGVLIHPSVVLTAAHIVFAIPAFEITVRAGEVAIFRVDAQHVQERIAKKIVQHKDYYSPTMEYAASLVFLKSPFDMSSRTVGVACLPRNIPAPNTLCYGTGWGQKDQNNLHLSAVLKKIPLPIVDRKSCQAMYRKTRLRFFRSHLTHLCAGGLKDVDTCDGDGGAPLVCPLENHSQNQLEPHRFVSAGLAAFSVGCGQENVPGSYVNLGQMRGWVDDTMRDEGLEETYNY